MISDCVNVSIFFFWSVTVLFTCHTATATVIAVQVFYLLEVIFVSRIALLLIGFGLKNALGFVKVLFRA
jgi:hypothetical protein